MCDDLNVRSCDMGIGFDEVGSEDGGEELGRGDRVFFCFDVDGVLHGVGGYDYAVVGFGVTVGLLAGASENGKEIVRCVDSTFQEYADCHLSDGLNSSLLITVDFVDADIVLAITGCSYRCHR